MTEGCENTMALWRKVREQGFAGSYRQGHRFVAERRTAPASRKWLGRDRIPCGEFDNWLAEAEACGVRALESFAAGLQQDGAAVRTALTMPWSNGQAEGQITRLKLIKRTMSGRASFDLLRRRVLLAA